MERPGRPISTPAYSGAAEEPSGAPESDLGGWVQPGAHPYVRGLPARDMAAVVLDGRLAHPRGMLCAGARRSDRRNTASHLRLTGALAPRPPPMLSSFAPAASSTCTTARTLA
jgi:hypothetical protein